jgi:hypothetical protein
MKMMYKDVRSSSKSNISRDTLGDFLNSYQHEGNYLGEIVREDKKWGIKPNEEFMPAGYKDSSASQSKVKSKPKGRRL